ncbi:MAG TPA: extracellular solute-binding protein [Candidatus Limnocylindrales bacterium]|nr:extracellular solute-binding protein [Candidatus Limnocylindrales bacterium]
MERNRRVGAHDWTQSLDRRDFLKLMAALAGSTTAISLIEACAPRRQGVAVGGTGDPGGEISGTITMIAGGGDPTAEPALKKVYDDFGSTHPGVRWDIRPLPGGGPEWDRLARGLLASGEAVDLVMMNGQQVRAWARDHLLADLGGDPRMSAVLDRVPPKFRLGGPGETATRAFALAATRGVDATGLYYNLALLDAAGIGVPRTIADLETMVKPLARLGAAPLVHCSGDVFFNQILLTWILPMIVERAGADPEDFAERTVKGEIRYDSPEWTEAFDTIAGLHASGVMLDGSGATDYAAMQQLFLRGKAATTFQGTWMLPELRAAAPSVPFELHVAPPPLIDGAARSRPIVAWAGFALPATSGRPRDAVYAFLEYSSRSEVDAAVVEASQVYSSIAASNERIVDPVAREFLPLFDDAIPPLDWLWEPEITAEIDSQVQALVKGETVAGSSAKAVQAVADELRSTGRSYYP